MGARKSAQGGLPLRNARDAARTRRRISCGTSETKVAPSSAHPSSPPHLIIYIGARKSARSSAHPSSLHSRPCTPLQAEVFHPLGRRLAVRGKVASQEATTPRTGGVKFPPVWKFLSSRAEISFLPCGDFFPSVWKFSSSRVEIFLLPYGSFLPPVWKFLSSRVEILLLPCGNFFPPVWKFSSSRAEIFFLPCGNFLPPVWKFSSSRMEVFFLPCGNFLPPVWKFSSSRMEIFTPRKGLENRVYYLFIVSPSKISSL